jgi:hypothetical protein
MMHPDNPFRGADSAIIRVLPVVLLVLTMVAMLEFTRWRLALRSRSYSMKSS